LRSRESRLLKKKTERFFRRVARQSFLRIRF
jgi:hypothetical protein